MGSSGKKENVGLLSQHLVPWHPSAANGFEKRKAERPLLIARSECKFCDR
jgi:hypothetical protein